MGSSCTASPCLSTEEVGRFLKVAPQDTVWGGEGRGEPEEIRTFEGTSSITGKGLQAQICSVCFFPLEL